MEENYQQMNFDDCGFPYAHITASVPARELRPGDRVRMVNCPEAEHAGRAWTVISDPWEVCDCRMVLLDGFCGGFDCARLEKIK